jgi:subtilisin family serine protease/outer membrane protein OmpA-like peptidoglycan-associated protein
MDPALRELQEGVETEELEVILKLRHPQAAPPHVRLVARFGQVVTGRVERRWIREVWGHPDVISFKAPRLLRAEPEIIDLEAASDVAWRDTDQRRPAALSVTGRGVAVALVDVGCDFAHPHFRHADGSTRLLALWDQSKTASPLMAAPYGYGVVYSRDDINRALAHSQPYKTLGYHPAHSDPLGVGAHGTLVLDIAAGNGQTTGSPQGVAPDADLIFVHAATGVMGGLANLGDSVRILEALDFIARAARGRPWVANISMGRRGGSHDGLSLVEQGLDALLLNTPGAAVVLSTGNYFSSQAHASGQLRPVQQRTLTWRTDKADITPNELEIWYSGKDAMILEVRVPRGGPLFRVALAEDCPVLIGGRNVGHIYHRARDPNNGDNQINIFLRPEAPAGDWQVTLIGEDIVDGLFHAWVERDAPCPHCDSRLEPQDADPYCTTGTLCNGFRTIAAGAYDGHSPNREIAYFSSCGPLRDFRQKPDLVAPGVKVLGARSAPRGEDRHDSWLTRMSGTSFAAPHVTGTIALMFEAAGRPLAIQETRRLVLGSTRSLSESLKEAVRFGSGYLDIEQVVAATRQFKEQSQISGTIPQNEAQGDAFAPSSAPTGVATTELTMDRDDEDPKEEGLSERSLSEVELTESAKKRFFILVSGGPGPFDDRDVEHDHSWANYVTPPLLMTDTAAERKKFTEKDEEVWWLIYRPAYACRWKDDFGNRSPKRQKTIKEVTDQGFTSYLDLLHNRARNRGWNLHWLDDADGFWKIVKTFPKGSISRLWFWGHARDDLWLSLGHQSDVKGTAIAPEPHEIIQVADIDVSLHDRFQAGDAKRINRFVGCNTAAFAKAWAKAFKVWTEGVEAKVGFKSINLTGGEPCLVGSAAARVFKPGGVEDAAATTSYHTCKDLGLGEALEFAEMEVEEVFPDTGFEFMKAEVEELGEPDDVGIDIKESEEGSTEEFMEKEEDLGQRLVEVADRLIASGGSPVRPAAFLSRVLSEAGIEVFGDPLRPGVVRFPSPEVIWKARKRPGSDQWDYIKRFLDVAAGPGELLGEPLQKGDILVRLALGEPGLGHLALIVDPQLWRREELAALGLTPEGHRPGWYAQVAEGGARPHGSGDGFARRLVDEARRLPNNQLILRLQSGRESIEGVIEGTGGEAEAEKCKQDWLKFLARFPEDVREALAKQGPDAAVVVAIHSGARDLTKLTDLSFYAKNGGKRGYCPIKDSEGYYKIVWNGEMLHVKEFLKRPSPPLVQKGGIKCHKVERKIETPKPDKPGVNITGRYEHRYPDPADKKWIITDYTLNINQAGRHIEGFLTEVLRHDAKVKDRFSTRFHGDLQSDGRFLVYSIGRPEETWGYFSYEQKGPSWHLYWQRMANDEIKPMGSKMGWVKISDTPTLMESAFSDQAFPPEGPVHDHERWPLTQAQIKNLVTGFDQDRIAPLLNTYFTTPADDTVTGRNALIDAAQPLHRHIGEVFTHKYYGIHLYDMAMAWYYVRNILSQNRWKFKQITRSQLDWIQIMLDVVSGFGFRLPNVTDYLGLKPTFGPGQRPGDPTLSPHTYKVSFSLKGLAVYYRGNITIEKTSGKTWKETFKIALKGLQVKPGLSISESGEAETYHEWLPADIPGSVELVTGKLGGSVPGIKATAGAWFMHIFGSSYLPYMDVLGEQVKLKLNLSKKFKLDIVNLGGLWGEIYSKNLPDKDYSKFVPVTDYSATYGLKDDVHFCLDSALLTEDARQALRIMCANEMYLWMSPTTNLTIYGHTDRSAGADYNLKLSDQRARNTLQAIRDILGDKFAIPETQIKLEGKGETEAMKDGRPDKEFNPKYRRVDVILNTRLVITLKAA